jgi:hypothetical protein
MTTAARTRLVILLCGLSAAGCVERRFVIESNVPNAQVYIDNKPVGAAPAYAPFEYYGYHNVTVVHPGYQSVTQRIKVAAPWYAYPPIDFLAEVLYPYHIEDVRRHHIELLPAPQTRTDDLISNADALRLRGYSLQSAAPASPVPPANQPIIGQPVNPGPPPVPPSPTPGVPPPTPLIPSVTPAQFGPPPGGSYLR